MPLQQDTEGFTALAMGDPAGQQGHGLFVQFYMHPAHDIKESDKQGRPIYQEKEYVRIMVPGDKSSIIERPIRLGHTPSHDNNKFPLEYARFKQNEEQVLTGTMLSEWPVMSRSRVKELEFFNVFTVEQLAGMSDANIQNFRGLSDSRSKAIAFLESAKEGAPLVTMQAKLAKRDDELDALRNQVEELVKELGESKGRKKKE